MQVKKRDGRLEPVSMDKVLKRIEHQMAGLNRKFVEPILVAQKVVQGLYDGVSTVELDNLAAEVAAGLTGTHPDYSTLASRIAISNLYKQTPPTFSEAMVFIGINSKRLDQEFCEIVKSNAEIIDFVIDNSRDSIFDYFGFKTLERSYLIKVGEKIIERPQYMWMRVSIGIWGDNLEEAFKTYHLMSQGYFTHATPTLFNAGTPKPQMSSCFLIANKGDSLEGIMETCTDVAKISAAAGGIGLHIHDVRASGSYIHKSGGTSKGLMPLMKTYNELAKWWDQCFVEETKVLTDKGYKKISKLKEGELVRTTDNKFHEIKEVKSFSQDGELINIKSKIGEVKVTENHCFLVIKGHKGVKRELIISKLKSGIAKIEWLEAHLIEPGDLIVTYEQCGIEKKCSKCNESKEINRFHRDLRTKDGREFCCIECRSVYRKERRSKEGISEKYQKYNKEYREKNIKECREREKKYTTRREKDPESTLRIVSSLRSRVRAALKGIDKSASTLELIGCSRQQLKDHLQSLFQSGMTWDNYGEWHIDHKKPCSKFNLSKEEEQKVCFNYTNLQPLWAIDNLQKSNKY